MNNEFVESELVNGFYEYDEDIFQYFIISNNLADLLMDLTEEIIFYIGSLDVYVWGITHYGRSWDYVLTDIELYSYDDGQ